MATSHSSPTHGGTAVLHRRASAHFGELVGRVGVGQWHLATPCEGWDVRALVNHVVAENLWTRPLMEGRTIAEVGTAFDGDVLADDPAGAWAEAAAQARAAVDPPDALERTVHLSFGDTPAEEYVLQLFADHLIHAWDLAQAIGEDASLEPDLVDACADWFDDVEDAYRQGGAIGQRPLVPIGADAQTRLLARFGRSDALAAVHRFNGAFASHDVDLVMAALTDDCVFDSTQPPDGRRYEGQEQVRACWEELFAASPDAVFETEETVAAGDRAVVRWRYTFGDGHVRGVDLLTVRDGLISEKRSYVKG